MRDLIFQYDNNTVFSDASNDMRDFLRDDLALTFVAAEDALYIGLYKPFNALYTELTTASGSDVGLVLEISVDAGFSSLTFTDDTKGLTRSGFIDWDRDQDDWISSTINSVEAYWLKITTTSDFTASVRAMNLVFSDDNDLLKKQRNVDNLKAKNDSSFIAYHVAARDEIVQSLRNSGHVTRGSNSNMKDLTKWDLLDPSQVREAATMLALSNIMFDVSDSIEDKYYQRFKDYRSDFAEAFKLYLQSLDTDDDGVADNDEQNNFRTVEFIKV